MYNLYLILTDLLLVCSSCTQLHNHCYLPSPDLSALCTAIHRSLGGGGGGGGGLGASECKCLLSRDDKVPGLQTGRVDMIPRVANGAGMWNGARDTCTRGIFSRAS